jgi:TolB-like protein/DNA-binding winged helix-turn-helix (wHTH) protein
LSSETPRVRRFGVFEVDPREGELRKSGLRIKLQDQPFQLLVLLLERPGEIVTREELQRRLWPADTFVDFDHSLNSAVKRLREALQDQAENPRFVETVPKRGYRFIGPVSGEQPAGNQTAGVSQEPLARPHRRGVYVAGCALAALIVVGSLFWLNTRRVRETKPENSKIQSLVVMPFINASNNSDMDYLGDSLSEEITNSLSRLPNLRVMARSSVSHYKSQDDPQNVGRNLHVDAVLTGRVAEHGSELSVETELVDVASGAQLWGERYTRSADQASLLRTAITHDVAGILRPQLSGNERESLARVGTTNAEAYRLYLRGRYDFESWTPESLKAATDLFDRAAAMDPNFAAAHAGLADVYAVQGYMGYISGPALMEKARSAARRAVELDDQSPESHTALANLDLNYFWNFPEAEEEIQRALVLDPNSAYAHEVSCWIKVSLGRSQEGLNECRRAVELDPLSGRSNLSLAFEYYWARDYERAIEQANKTLELGLVYPQAVVALATVYEQLGNHKQAMSEWIEAERLSGHEERAAELKRIYDSSGYPGYLRKAAKDLEAEGRYYYAAREHARLGDKAAAFAALQKVFANRAGVRNMKVDPGLDNLRSDPRFDSLLRRIGFPP